MADEEKMMDATDGPQPQPFNASAMEAAIERVRSTFDAVNKAQADVREADSQLEIAKDKFECAKSDVINEVRRVAGIGPYKL